jgi:hypothetical protein
MRAVAQRGFARMNVTLSGRNEPFVVTGPMSVSLRSHRDAIGVEIQGEYEIHSTFHDEVMHNGLPRRKWHWCVYPRRDGPDRTVAQADDGRDIVLGDEVVLDFVGIEAVDIVSILEEQEDLPLSEAAVPLQLEGDEDWPDSALVFYPQICATRTAARSVGELLSLVRGRRC